jgi:hypothetical protein
MIHKAKSIIIGRMKRKGLSEDYPCFISIFMNGNDPHKCGDVPAKTLDFDEVHKVIITNLDVNYLPMGNDLVINDLEEINVEVKGPHIYLTGKQKPKQPSQ